VITMEMLGRIRRTEPSIDTRVKLMHKKIRLSSKRKNTKKETDCRKLLLVIEIK
jgi:hypothetical protein